MENFFFHGQLHCVGEFVAVAAEELDAVVLPWIVRGGDDYAGVEAMCACEECDGRCGDDAGAFDVRTCFAQARGEGCGDPRAGFAGVAAQENARLSAGFAQRVRQREADGIDGGGVERRFAGDGADAVSTEEFACGGCCHDLDFLPFLLRADALGAVVSTRLMNLPSARRVVTAWP